MNMMQLKYVPVMFNILMQNIIGLIKSTFLIILFFVSMYFIFSKYLHIQRFRQ